MEKSAATVYIVDDDADVCRALSRLLRSAGYRPLVFCSALEFLERHDPETPGCILMDLSMPELDGLEVQAVLASSGSLRPIIFLTGNATIPLTVAAIRAGAVNFLAKPVHEGRLFEAVDEALRIDAADHGSRRIRVAMRQRLNSLTPREREVLQHLLRGRLNKQIAGDLGTVEKTVKVHRARLMRKMGARSVAELVRLASVAGIVADQWRGSVPEDARRHERAPWS